MSTDLTRQDWKYSAFIIVFSMTFGVVFYFISEHIDIPKAIAGFIGMFLLQAFNYYPNRKYIYFKKAAKKIAKDEELPNEVNLALMCIHYGNPASGLFKLNIAADKYKSNQAIGSLAKLAEELFGE